jgi:hypothetical protein
MKNNNNAIRKIGRGEFGDIYTGIKGDEAIQFLLQLKTGEVCGAFVRLDIGEIDLIGGQGSGKFSR